MSFTKMSLSTKVTGICALRTVDIMALETVVEPTDTLALPSLEACS